MRNEQTIARTFQARFGSVIRSQRLSAELSQEELAHRSGLHRTYVTDVERGARNPSLNSIKKLSDALGVSLSELFSLVEGVERKDRTPDSGPGRHGASRNEGVTILVAEDSRTGVESLLQPLQANLANPIQFVHDGAEAIDYIFGTGSFKKRERTNTPDLVILDLGLTKVDGLEILAKLHEDPGTSSIPVIALVSPSSQDTDKAKQFGVAGFITSPIDFSKFLQALAQAGFQWLIANGPNKS